MTQRWTPSRVDEFPVRFNRTIYGIIPELANAYGDSVHPREVLTFLSSLHDEFLHMEKAGEIQAPLKDYMRRRVYGKFGIPDGVIELPDDQIAALEEMVKN